MNLDRDKRANVEYEQMMMREALCEERESL
jgi:hypothetical protein